MHCCGCCKNVHGCAFTIDSSVNMPGTKDSSFPATPLKPASGEYVKWCNSFQLNFSD